MEQTEEVNDVWKEIVRRWHKKKEEHTDSIRKLEARKEDLKYWFEELQKKMATSGFDSVPTRPQPDTTSEHQNTQQHQIPKENTTTGTAKQVAPTEKVFTNSFKRIVAYTIEQVEIFFKDDLKSDDVLLLLDRIDYLELRLTQLLQVFEDKDN